MPTAYRVGRIFMIRAASWLDRRDYDESLAAFKHAGADSILTYRPFVAEVKR
jgi:delta-aminolevulinic acid dehydratase/porphobilinogen synthase